jgi:ribosome-binding protein aMBF1 (putative translation factor)
VLQVVFSFVLAMQIISRCSMKSAPQKKNYIDQPLVDEISRRIRECMKARKMSIFALSTECEVAASQISRIELGKVNVSVSMLYKIAEGLKIDPKKLQP